MNAYDLRLHGGRVFLHGAGLTTADVLVGDGRIAGIVDPAAPADAAETVELKGATVLPGAIDPHVHLGKDIRVPRDREDAERETASAVAGGVTSMLVYLMSADPYDQVHHAARAAMESGAHTDFGFHFVLGTDEHVRAVPDYVRELGVSSFKFFMNFRGDEGAYLGMPGNDDGFMYDLLGTTADAGAMVNPHPENIEIVWRLRKDQPDESQGPLHAWHQTRPPLVEAEAEQRVAYLAAATGASAYAVHTSSAAGLDVMRMQRTAYPHLYVETCTHYLTLTTASACGVYGKVNPPLRPSSDREALWAGLADGSVDTVGSDHNARHRSFKEKDIWSASAGFPGTGVMLPLTLGEGLRRGVPLERLVHATSTRAAKLFGLYPRKGVIRVGSDADLAVVDLDGENVIAADRQYSAAAYTPWEGHTTDVRVLHTLVRGRFAVRDGLLGDDPRGVYLHRERSGATALAAAGREETA
ncbi:amidohydrolase family protein [Streptomyces sp. DSM 42041]|uniref:Amidohydrolase family protein n=1 Tax=Streptomyces hazeniae TaxID=3075538 RepID=A0ABU2NM90_9ACTN|nr:amidohydrolase family protein [Streptomyces sp. DSM 42041]MDT0377854.1 amidohydrolase family protein [Streptomyces sp. DSM 42041]